MGAAMARAYLDYGEDAFKVVTALHGVKPRDHGAGGLKYRREDLDRIVDAESYGAQPADSPPPPEHDPAALALKRVGARSARH